MTAGFTPFEWQAFWEAVTSGHHLDPDPLEREPDYEPDYLTDNQADREYGADADHASDRYEAWLEGKEGL